MGSGIGALALPVAGAALGAATGGLGFGLTGFSLFQAAAAGASIANLVGGATGVGTPKAGNYTPAPLPAPVTPPPATQAATPASSAVMAAGTAQDAGGGSRAGAAASMGGTVGAAGPQGLVAGQSTEKSSLLGG